MLDACILGKRINVSSDSFPSSQSMNLCAMFESKVEITSIQKNLKVQVNARSHAWTYVKHVEVIMTKR